MAGIVNDLHSPGKICTFVSLAMLESQARGLNCTEYGFDEYHSNKAVY